MTRVLQELRNAVRNMRNAPGVAVVAILTIAA